MRIKIWQATDSNTRHQHTNKALITTRLYYHSCQYLARYILWRHCTFVTAIFMLAYQVGRAFRQATAVQSLSLELIYLQNINGRCTYCAERTAKVLSHLYKPNSLGNLT